MNSKPRYACCLDESVPWVIVVFLKVMRFKRYLCFKNVINATILAFVSTQPEITEFNSLILISIVHINVIVSE